MHKWWILGTLAVVGLVVAGPAAAQQGYSHGNGYGAAGFAEAMDQEPIVPRVGSSPFQEEAEPGCGGEGCGGCSCQTCDCCCDCCEPGLVFYVDWLNWKARRRGLDFAINPTGPTSTVTGQVESLSYERDDGVRTGLGYRFPSCWDVTWNYTYFHTTAAGSATAPPEGALRTTRAHPVWGAYAAVAEASASLDYDINDIEVGRRFYIDDTAEVRLFGGFRWAIIDQRFTALYDGVGYVNGVIDNPMKMDGYGIRVGAKARWNRGCWSLFGRGAGSVLVGRFDTRLLQTDDQSGTVVDVSDNFTQAAPGLEAAAGLAWRRECLEISGGYEMTAWLNMAERFNFHDYRDWGNFGNSSNDLILEGFFVRLSIDR